MDCGNDWFGPEFFDGTVYMEPQEFPASAASVQASFGAHSRRGRSQLRNGDHYLILELGRHQQTLFTSLPESAVSHRYDEFAYAMIVADGSGGTDEGEAASRVALGTLLHLVLHFGKWNLRIINDRVAHEVMRRAERFYQHVDLAVSDLAAAAGPSRPQTTLTAVFGTGRDLFFAHVGHSRAYLFRDGQLSRLTRDHAVARNQSDLPMAPLVNVVARDLTHLLTETIGMRGSTGPAIDLEHFELNDGDRILVCTNGVTDAVAEPTIAAVLATSQSPADQSRTLVQLVDAAGGEDDATALVALYRVPH
jgi:protein phosphatase